MFRITDGYPQHDQTVYGVRKTETGETEFLVWRGTYERWVWANARYYDPAPENIGARREAKRIEREKK